MVVATLLLKQLREMNLAVEGALERCIVRGRQKTTAVRAFEARLVVLLSLHAQLRSFLDRTLNGLSIVILD